ncbi:dmx-like protein [Dermatophagoides farinae]|uniref:Dmx-like protein n=1 Tax=Dermatophagoides farinae TaxID=6954 RepID=A0A9D4P4V0_DERFA|nr:dmx-like protein [Dermatophagoides farinae]
MKCHQILTGAVNSGDNTYSTGCIDGINFTVYCSGCNIVILSGNFEPIQIIPGTLNGNVQVNCVDASNDVGKIAACYGGPIRSNQLMPAIVNHSGITNRIAIFEPIPITDQISDHRLDYRWIKTGEIEPNCSVSVLSWNIEGTKLLIGGVQIQLWHSSSLSIDGNTNTCESQQQQQQQKSSNDEGIRMKPIKDTTTISQKDGWNCIWSCQTSTPICHLSFSPDGTLFCSTGRSDRLVKIWYETTTPNYPSNLFDTQGSTDPLISSSSSSSFSTIPNVGHGKSYRSNLSYSFIYIPHPRAVIGISWRKVSKYMPRGSVANMLVTSCRDNICRLWVQTFLPEDDLVNVSQLDNVSDIVTPRAQTQRHRQKILHFFRHKKSVFRHHHHHHHHNKSDDHLVDHHGDSSSNLQQQNGLNDSTPILNLPSTYSCHDFHGYGVHGTAITPGGVHFHLTASINAESDIPLVPSLTQHPSESDIHSQSNLGPKVTVSQNDGFDSPGGGGGNISSSSRHGHQQRLHHHEESDKPLFVVNWLNNKEMAFTQSAERILHEIVATIVDGEQQRKQQQEQAEQHQRDQDEMSEASQAFSENTVESFATKRSIQSHQPGSAQPAIPSSSRNSSSNVSIMTAVGPDQSTTTVMLQDRVSDQQNRRTVADYLDRKLESLMREWNQSTDLLYSIHPLDGSLLVWLVEWLDEPCPSVFRQPQISFSSRIPNSLPLGDASTMSHNVSLYSPHCCLDLKTILCTSSASIINAALQSNIVQATTTTNTVANEQHQSVNLAHKTHQQHNQQQPLFGPTSYATPTLCMITKHNNGSLNLWKLSFSEKGHFTQLLSIGHSRRVCGHRFRVNDISCHPVLPLLLTTSHHNLPGTFRSRAHSFSPFDHTPNTPDSTAYLVSPSTPNHNNQIMVESRTFPNTGFCSELILWKVEPVGPLMKFGGVTELARINSLEPTSFANVAWIPTLLPSTTLGPITNSPSACFVASDGRQLRIYQVVIDARSLLAEAQRYMFSANDSRRFYYDSSEEDEDDETGTMTTKERKNIDKVDHDAFRSLFKIVSLQSTARPGCVLELSPIVDARHDWQNTQLLHLFQEQLIIGDRKIRINNNDEDLTTRRTAAAASASIPPTSADSLNKTTDKLPFDFDIHDYIDSRSTNFEEVFYLVVIETTGVNSTLHMWQITISSGSSNNNRNNLSSTTVPFSSEQSNVFDEDSSRSVSPENNGADHHYSTTNQQTTSPSRIKSKKVCTQRLTLPSNVEIIHATPSAGHLSSSNIYPACYAPFLIATACSDNRVRFWSCKVLTSDFGVNYNDPRFEWIEWEMAITGNHQPSSFSKLTSIQESTTTTITTTTTSSVIELPGSPLHISCAYSGRIACAFKYGHSYIDLSDELTKEINNSSDEVKANKKESRFINVGISIYECQSSGGSEWVLEDTIRVDRIPLIGQSSAVENLGPLVDFNLRNSLRNKFSPKISPNIQSTTNPFMTDIHLHSDPIAQLQSNIKKQAIHPVPSCSTLHSLKQTIAEQGNQFTFCQKSPIILDWVSTEDGCHMLTCSVGHKLALFAPISHTTIPSNTGGQEKMISPSPSTLIPQQSNAAAVSPSSFRMNILDLSLSTIPVTRWMMLRITELNSIDGLPPLPMQLSWVRDGILVVGMDNEMLIFSQWKIRLPTSLPIVFEQNLNIRASHRNSLAFYYPFNSVEFQSDRLFIGNKENKMDEQQQQQHEQKPTTLTSSIMFASGGGGDKIISDEFEDLGAFESFHNSSPVIPQYHPKQLMELLAFGKIHRVRAILSHLVYSLCSINSVKEYLHHPANMQQQHSSFESSSDRSPRQWTRTRALSVAAQHSPRGDVYSGDSYGDANAAPIVAEEIQLDYTEIASIRPLPLYALIQADEGVTKDNKTTTKDNDNKSTAKDSGLSWNLDSTETLDSDFLEYNYKTQVEETLDEFLGNRTAFNFSNVATNKYLKSQQSQQQQQQQDSDTELHISINFDQKQARLLTKLLTHSHLPGLTSLDQMHLLALADSLASFNEIDQNQARSTRDESINFSNDSNAVIDEQQLAITANSLDDCGLRYLLNMRQHVYLLKCLSLKQRNTLQKNGLGTHNIIWAFHSETQEELVQLIMASSNKIGWQELRELGVGFWIRNNSLLKKVIERLAKTAFKQKNDPLDASLYYLAMRKKNLVWGLYRSCHDKKMTDFFSHNFTEDKWRKAALKNAYVLMGKQRFEHSVSFFLLAGSLWDAVEICLNKLNDLQLAMVIIRLYEGGDIDAVPETLKRLLNEEILGYQKNIQNMQYAHPDPFLRSMAYWMLGEYNLSLSTLLEMNVGNKHYQIMMSTTNSPHVQSPTTTTTTKESELLNAGGDRFEGLHSNVFNFYLYLRTQPLIVRRAQVARQNIDTQDANMRSQKKSHMFTRSSNKSKDAVAVTPFERRLFFLTAYRHLQAGCPSLALEVLSRLPTNIVSDSEKNEMEECSRRLSIPDAATAVGYIRETPETPQAKQQPQAKAADLFSSNNDVGGGFDWGTPSSNIFAPVATDEFKIDFGKDDDDDDDVELSDDERKNEKKVLIEDKNIDADDDIFNNHQNIKAEDQDSEESSNIDMMAQQFKFISCLKIIMEELSTLATGFEVDGGQLRYQLYIWLERSVEVLKEICKYHTFSMRSVSYRSSIDNTSTNRHGHSLVPPPPQSAATNDSSSSTSNNRQSGILVKVVGGGNNNRKSSDNSTTSMTAAPSLHEILLADKEDFQSKLERCHRRKQWLSTNEALLLNLLSYCSLHGGHGGGLASVRMELILLLQELRQDRSPQQQLLSPLPLPTTLPLLTASVASQKTVVADPIRHLQSMAHDILQTLTEINTYVHIRNNTNHFSFPDFLALPPFMVSGTAATTLISMMKDSSSHTQQISQQQNYIGTLYTLIHILRDLGISLSSCIYQSLCDCDSVTQGNKDLGTKIDPSGTTTSSNSGGDGGAEDKSGPTTNPSKWPGVQALQALIAREKDEDLPKLHTLLCEGFVAVYLSQLVYALTICDSSILYRLIGLRFSEKSWGDLFGGGTKKLLYVSTSTVTLGQSPGTISPNETTGTLNGTTTNPATNSPHYDLLNTLSKQRMKLHMKILEQLNQAAEVVGNVATSPSSTLQNITNPFLAQQQQQQQPGQSNSGLTAPTLEQRPTYREVFVPPNKSIINHLMVKPELPDDLIHLDYDSFGSEDEMDDENDETSLLSNKFRTSDTITIDDDEYNEWATGGNKSMKNKMDKSMERKKANLEYELYAWCIIRLAATKISYEQINNFLQIAGIEKTELPTISPFIHSTLRTIIRWQCSLQFYMNEFTNIPDHFLPNMFVDNSRSSGSIQRYKSLFENNNTPFRAGYTSIKSAKRLWNYLVRQPSVQDIFIRYIFGKDRSLKLARDNGATSVCNANSGVVAINDQYDSNNDNTMKTTLAQSTNEDVEMLATNKTTESAVISSTNAAARRIMEPMRIVHKDQDNISAFCMDRSNSGLIALSTPKEIQELNIKSLLEVCVPWLEEDTEMDIYNLKQRSFQTSSYVDFLLVQHPADRLQTSPGGLAFQKQSSSAATTGGVGGGSNQQQQTPTKQPILVKRHKTETVRRLASHPTLPLYLSGGQDGCVQLWEWTYQQPISTPRPAGTYAKVTHVGFSQPGSKFGVTDSDGTLSLWQTANTSANPFWNFQCHNKTTSDFTFLSSSSLLMAAGHSTDHRNVVLVDTLVPRERSIVLAFACHEHNGASSIIFAPLSQLIITGGKKGDIFIFDIRQRIQKDHFHAHDSAVKCIALEPNEEFFATGSADGDIKVWSLYGSNRSLLHSFPGEHARNTFFRNIGMGVSHLYIDTCGRLFSCGADGSLKMRHLPTLECQPTNFFMPHSQSSASLIFGNSNNTVDNDHDQQQQQQQQQQNRPSNSYESNNYINGTTII